MLPVAALFADGNMPNRVMDVAAAPGSKTTQIAARMGNKGGILANEYSASRVKVLHANISRCGIGNVALTHFDGRVFGAALPECFDAILLDAPCSGEGVVRKDPDALKNWSPESNASTAETQRELIDSAFHALRPGGTLVYSTCTLNRQENEDVVNGLLARYPQAAEVLPLGSLFPQASEALTEEGFLHVFRRFSIAKASSSPVCVKPPPSHRCRRRVIRSVNSPLSRLKAANRPPLRPPLPPLACIGALTIRSGSGIKKSGYSLRRSSRYSAKCAFPASVSVLPKPTTKAIAGSTKRSLRLPRLMPLLS